MGNRSSWQTVSQNSTGKDDPCFLRVLKRESSALRTKSGEMGRAKDNGVICLQASYFEILSVHDDIVETE
jgi:hypothetical protein